MTKELFLPSKPRYDILDGLRGVAALVILLYHVLEGCGVILGHGNLGVDFFYVLSGFVIGYAYDDRWDRMNVGGFFKRRIIRLHPMVIMGTAIGLALYYFQTSDALPLIGQRPWWVGASAFLLLLPDAPDAQRVGHSRLAGHQLVQREHMVALLGILSEHLLRLLSALRAHDRARRAHGCGGRRHTRPHAEPQSLRTHQRKQGWRALHGQRRMEPRSQRALCGRRASRLPLPRRHDAVADKTTGTDEGRFRMDRAAGGRTAPHARIRRHRQRCV